MVIILYTLLAVLLQPSHSLGEPCIAQTNYGQMLGNHMTSRSNTSFCAFLAVPFAAPPTGNLRFQPPLPPKRWEGRKSFTQEGNKCIQRGLPDGSEDCLYLNVFARKTRVNDSLAVMVYFHGGGFYLGSTALSTLGPEYFMVEDVILVTSQYRIGPFGFLSTEDEVVPGNMGMKDQVQALRWVSENIKYFGGDPEKVTIFGNSAGGVSVHFHMLSPLSKRLFARGISQSGTAFTGFALAEKGICKNVTEHLAKDLNCSAQSSEQILECLQSKEADEILNAYNQQLNARFDFNKMLLRPVVEKESNFSFITQHPETLKSDKPWLTGVNANEGLFKIRLQDLNKTMTTFKTSFDDFGPQLLFFEGKYIQPKEAARKIYTFYFENASLTEDFIKGIDNLVTDNWFIWPLQEAAQQHEGTLYLYLYDHRGENSYTGFYKGPKGYGVSHLDELIVLFSHDIFPKLNKIDTNISKLMVNMWVNFAKNGNPTPTPISSNPQIKDETDCVWEAANNTKITYLHIQTNNLTMQQNMYKDRMDFWHKLFTQTLLATNE